MIQIRKSNERGHANHGWLDSHHTFSFADYYDPENTHFSSLRVINEDRVAPKMGFGMHPHRDMEIISYVVDGALRHRDSMGNTAVMRSGDVQRISAGSGITHSEVNDSGSEPVHFLQIWIMPDQKNAKPAYAEKSYAKVEEDNCTSLLRKPDAMAPSRSIRMPTFYVAKLKEGKSVKHAFTAGRNGWLQIIDGEVKVNGELLSPGDAAAVTKVDELTISAVKPAHFLLFDLN